MEEWWWALTISIGGMGFIFGCLFADWQQNAYIESKGKPGGRTPLHCRGRFYYVIPEKEYIDLRAEAHLKGSQ